MPYQPTTNFVDSSGIDLGKKLVTKDYLLSVYAEVVESSSETGLSVSPGLWTWGKALNGALGNNTTTPNRLTPGETFAGGTNWKQISYGNGFAAAIKTDGTLWTWGKNNQRQCGNNYFVDVLTPITTFVGGNDWKQVSCGEDFAGAVKNDGTLWMWGSGSNGQLGRNSTILSGIPVNISPGTTNWKQVSCGVDHTAAIKTDGTLWTWGLASSGQLGDRSTVRKLTPVTTFAGGTNWKMVSCNGSNTAAIKTDGTLWTWGSGNVGRNGNNQSSNRSTPVTTFAGGTNWKMVSVGRLLTGAIKTDGSLWRWGDGVATTPSPSITGNDWKQVSVGNYVYAAIKVDGSLWTWGTNAYGQLGDNTTTTNYVPHTPTISGSGYNWKQVSIFHSTMGAIRSVNEI